MFHLHRRSSFLFGRERDIVDIPIEHPSCSKQHAAIQYRQITKRSEFGEISKVIKPYLIDLDSTNGTFLNEERISGSRYIELVNNDVIRFGNSTREYVFIDEEVVDEK
jgi:smad nuclear-interacting protein 1